MNLLIMIKNFHNVRPIKTKSCLQTSYFPKKTLSAAVKRTFANLAFNVLTVARTTRPSLATWDSVATVLEGKQARCVRQSCRLPSWHLTLFTPKNRLVSAITSSATFNKPHTVQGVSQASEDQLLSTAVCSANSPYIQELHHLSYWSQCFNSKRIQRWKMKDSLNNFILRSKALKLTS